MARYKTQLAEAVLDCIISRQRRFIDEGSGEIFEGILESDLAHELRDRRWRLPAGWLSEVKDAGFTVKQVYDFRGDVRTYFEEEASINPATGNPWKYDAFARRKLSQYNTIIRL